MHTSVERVPCKGKRKCECPKDQGSEKEAAWLEQHEQGQSGKKRGHMELWRSAL